MNTTPTSPTPAGHDVAWRQMWAMLFERAARRLAASEREREAPPAPARNVEVRDA
jgi:hypothetical protein